MLIRISETELLSIFDIKVIGIEGNEDDGYNIVALRRDNSETIIKRDFKLLSSAVKYLDKLEEQFRL